MQYVSTRGGAAPRDFAGVLRAGLAEDGGLFVPAAWPFLRPCEWRALRGVPYPVLAARLIGLFTAGSVPGATVAAICEAAYARFVAAAVVPLVQLGPSLWVQELFHGPTLAFKDLAMQVLGGLFEAAAGDGPPLTIIGATSGDTGSAAIAALAGGRAARVAILHPAGRTSEVQRRQMTTVRANNVLNIAVEGNFDDCQALVKAMFSDADFRARVRLSGVNSINWARIAAQIPYYAAAALALGGPDRAVNFAVPTGNFGNVLAANGARAMGLPIAKLIVATNRNDILHRFFEANDMRAEAVVPSLSPSMDIQVSSNFERLLFDLLGRDAARTADVMAGFAATGRMEVPDAAWAEVRGRFGSFRLDDAGTLSEMRDWAARGYVADPHTAVGLAAARAELARDPVTPVVVAGTAHPAKFPDAVREATGAAPGLPPHLADLFEREERYVTLPNDLAAVRDAVRAFAA